MDKRLLQIADFKVKPGKRNYHYAALATIDENGKPYVRLRSPTVQRTVTDLRKELDVMLESSRSRLSPEEIKEIISLDKENHAIIDQREELILFMEELGNPDHIKRTLSNLNLTKQGVLVCLEAEIVMYQGRFSNPRLKNGNDAIIKCKLEEIYEKDHPYFIYRKNRYMIQLASFHLASFKPEEREKRFDESVPTMFTLRAVDIEDFNHRFEHPIDIPLDKRLDNPEQASNFINNNSCGVIASVDHEKNEITAIPVESFSIPDLGEGVFIQIDVTQELGKKMFERIKTNLMNHNDPYLSYTIPTMGMGAELGLAYEGKVKINEELIEKAIKFHSPIKGTKIVYLDPQRITDISTPQTRRGRIIYSHFKEIGWN
ncbi:MAG: hypothetical protein ACFFAU_05895 [Candidatus Hodarchaeota archaeon]